MYNIVLKNNNSFILASCPTLPLAEKYLKEMKERRKEKMKYDYIKEMKEDVRNYIEENKGEYNFKDIEELKEKLADDMFIADEITGNGSGSYTFNRHEAEENIAHNMDLLKEACQEFGADPFDMFENPEKADVTIRCYLLGQVIDEVLKEMAIGKNKTKITIIKYVQYFEKGNLIKSENIFKTQVYTLNEAIEILNNEKLSYYYNKKAISLQETITATYKTEENSYKVIRKTVDFDGQVKKDF